MILNNSAIRLVPGSDETELYVSWHCPADAPSATLLISRYEDMSGSHRYKPEVLPAETPDFRINRVIVRGLKPDTQYYYAAAYDGKITGDVYSYHTRDLKRFSVLFSTDVQLGWSTAEDYPLQLELWNKTINTALEKSPELNFIVHCGDQTVTGRRIDEWWGYYSPDALRSLPIFSVLGNHDRKGDTLNYYTFYPNHYNMLFPSRPNLSDISKQPVFGRDSWFRYGDVLFVHFDSTCGSATDHYRCAKEAVESNPNVKWIIGLMHHDLYGGTSSAGQIESTVLFRQIFTPIFDKFGFDAILTGHSHAYSRSHQIFNRKIVDETKGLTEVFDPIGTVYISGCCGANKYDVSIKTTPMYPWTAYRYGELDNVSTVLSFDDTDGKYTLKVDTYECKTGDKVDSYKIVKTQRKRFGGTAVENALSTAKFCGVKGLAGVYMVCDTAYRFYQGKMEKKKNYTPHEELN